MRAAAPFAAVATLLAACAPVVPREPRPNVIHVVFDPDAGRAPSPSNLARVPMDGTFPASAHLALPVPEDAPAALRSLAQGFAQLEGWSAASVIAAELTGEIDPQTLTPSTVLLYRGAAPGSALQQMAWRFSADPDPAGGAALPWLELVGGKTIRVHPPVAAKDDPAGGLWLPGETYLVALRGGTAGINGAPGPDGSASVEADATFYLLRQTQHLDAPEHESVFPGRTRAERVAKAKQAEAIRQLFSPLLDKLAEGPKWPRTDVAAMWTFTVTRRPEVFYDSDSSRVPLPNDLLRDPVTGKVTVPVFPADSDAEKETKAELSKLDGFSTSGDITLRFTRPIDPSTVNDASVKLVDRAGVPVRWKGEISKDGKTLYLHVTAYGDDVLVPLAETSEYAAFVGDGVKGVDGRPVSPMPVAIVAALDQGLLEDGHSALTPLVDDTSAERLERVRAQLAPHLERAGVDRLHLAAAFAFTTLSITRPLMALREEVYDPAGPPSTVSDLSTSTPADKLLLMPSVSKIVEGKLALLDHLDPVNRQWSHATPRQAKVPFLLTVPSGASGRLKTVVFGHGLYTSRVLAYFIANVLASHGYATAAIDFPYHGARTVCLKDADCSQGACSPDGACRKADGSAGTLATLNGVPVATGAAFVDVEHLNASRDHFRQAVADLHQFVRVLRQADFSPVGISIDPATIHYAGVSLGGIIGTTFVPLEPGLGSAVFNVAGADLPDLFEQSGIFGPQLTAALAAKGIQKDTDAHASFKNAAHWMLDEVDPMNLVRHVQAAPLSVGGAAKPHRAFVQRALADLVVPAWCTKLEGRLGGLTVKEWAGSHGFLVDLELTSLPAQEQVAKFFDGVDP